ncbi:MAG: response regulator [Phycisphaerales bacterium]
MGSPKHIVVIEDETDLADLLVYNLQRAGYQVAAANDGVAGLKLVLDHPPDLIVLDLMLPKMSGFDVARQVRTSPRTCDIPILMLTARAEEIDQVTGFKVGADDYVTKPCSMKVLVARVESLLRRSRPVGPDAQTVEVGPLRADLTTHEMFLDEAPLKLTLTEFRLLVALMRSKGKVLSREDLMYTAMGPAVLVTARTIDVHVAAIRRKIAPHGDRIRTIRGVGYMLAESPVAAHVGDEGGVDD